MSEIPCPTKVGEILIAILLVIFGLALLMLLAPHVNAAIFIYGTNYNYSEVVLPNNSYVHQGENISQGLYYDLSGVYGFTGKLAHWKDSDDAGIEAPDNIIKLDDYKFKHILIDPAVFPTGEWYQWDGAMCKKDSDICYAGFGHGNNYVFAVVKPLPNYTVRNETVIQKSNITVSYENTSIDIPVVAVKTVTITETEVTPDINATNVTTLVIPTTAPPVQTLMTVAGPASGPSSTPQIVTPKGALPIELIGAALIIGFVVFTRRGSRK